MAIQLLKLRNVPEDELIELYALLEQNDIEYYETSAGSWGISMPALWIRHNDQAEQAKALLKEYGEQRFIRVRTEYEELKSEGKARTFFDIVKEKPLKVLVYFIFVGVLVYLSIVPFVTINSG